MTLSEHVYCEAVTFKMTEWVDQRICIRFCIKLEHCSMDTIWIIQKATAMGNWWLAASSQQCTRSCITFHAEVFGKTSNHPVDAGPLQPRFGALRLLTFPKTKITFEKEEISDHWWNSGKWENATWQLMATGRTAWHTKMPTLKGTEASLSYLLCFLYLASSSINVTIFHITWMDIYTQGPAEVTPAWVWLVG